MEQNKLTEQPDQAKAQSKKSSAIIDAVLIGFLVGVVAYSVWKSSWGFLTLIPLFLIYKLTRKNR